MLAMVMVPPDANDRESRYHCEPARTSDGFSAGNPDALITLS